MRGWGEALVSSWMKTTIDVEMGGGTIVERNESNGRQRRARSLWPCREDTRVSCIFGYKTKLDTTYSCNSSKITQKYPPEQLFCVFL